MERERVTERERDELDLLAAEAGQSALLVGMTALMLVIALVLGFTV
jgi:phosphoribosylcarboxyaminoimidazole (NCAIR) mutase